MSAQAAERLQAAPATRTVYRVIKYRAEDLVVGDVIRNAYRRWSRITKVSRDKESVYVNVRFDVGGSLELRDVDLVLVQEVKA